MRGQGRTIKAAETAAARLALEAWRPTRRRQQRISWPAACTLLVYAVLYGRLRLFAACRLDHRSELL